MERIIQAFFINRTFLTITTISTANFKVCTRKLKNQSMFSLKEKGKTKSWTFQTRLQREESQFEGTLIRFPSRNRQFETRGSTNGTRSDSPIEHSLRHR